MCRFPDHLVWNRDGRTLILEENMFSISFFFSKLRKHGLVGQQFVPVSLACRYVKISNLFISATSDGVPSKSATQNIITASQEFDRSHPGHHGSTSRQPSPA